MRAEGREAVAASDNDHLRQELEKMVATSKEPLLVCFFSNGSFDGIIKAFSDHVKPVGK